MKLLKIGLTLTAIAALVGCGGGGGSAPAANTSPSSFTLSGVAATGAAIQGGTVTANCASGTGTSTTNPDGTYSVSVTGQLPCILKATDPITNSDYYSVAESGATKANITPLTNLVAANALGDSPATAYANFDSSAQSKITSTTLAAAQTNIQAATASLGADADMSNIDMLKTSFTPAIGSTAGDATDKKIDALMSSLAAANKRITDLEQQLKSSTTPTAASASLLSTLGTATDKLENCPYARSTTVWSFDMAGSAPMQFAIDYKAKTAKRIADNYTAAIVPKTDSNGNPVKCAFTSTIDGDAIEFRIAKGGNIVWAKSANFGLAAPAQTSWELTDKGAAGTYPTVLYVSKKTNRSLRTAIPMKLVINSDGTVDGFTCNLTKATPDCATTVEDSSDKSTCTQLQNGSFTCTSTSGSTIVGIIYVNGAQVTLYLAFTDMVISGEHWSGLSVSTKAREMKLPAVGESSPAGASWYAGVEPGSAQPITGLTLATTVESVNSSNNTYVTSTTGTAQTISNYINTPTNGLGYAVLSNAKAIVMVGNGDWALGIAKANSSTLWDGWYAYVKAAE